MSTKKVQLVSTRHYRKCPPKTTDSVHPRQKTVSTQDYRQCPPKTTDSVHPRLQTVSTQDYRQCPSSSTESVCPTLHVHNIAQHYIGLQCRVLLTSICDYFTQTACGHLTSDRTFGTASSGHNSKAIAASDQWPPVLDINGPLNH